DLRRSLRRMRFIVRAAAGWLSCMKKTSSISRPLSPLTWLAAVIAGCGGLLGWQAMRMADHRAAAPEVHPDRDQPAKPGQSPTAPSGGARVGPGLPLASPRGR